MAFRKKANVVLLYKPDILVIPECEQLEKLKFDDNTPVPNDQLWFGKNPNKGLGIFSYGKFRFKVLDAHDPELRMIIPIAVTGGKYDFILFAIWANNPGDPDGQYIEQVWKAIHHYDDYLRNKRTILVGDFNSNTIWDRKYREGNHSNVVKHLEKVFIVPIMSFTNKCRVKKPIRHSICTGIKINPIISTIVLFQRTSQKRLMRLK